VTKVVYEADLDLAKIKSKATELERILTEAFTKAGQAGSKDSGIAKALEQQAKAATEAAKQQRVLAEAIKAEEQGTTATAKAAATEREQAAKAEAQERISLARSTAQATIEADRQATIAAKADLAERTQAAKAATQAQIEDQKRLTLAARQQQADSRSGGGGLLGNLGGAITGGLAGYLSLQGAQQAAQQAVAIAELGTQARRTDESFRILSGGAQQATANINAIKEAGGGALTSLQAMDLADQAISLHLANTAQGFGDITRAAREIALVSPTIHDLGEAVSQLGLFAANPTSFARADQLGLGATEVKDRMKELQAANAGLDDSQAKLQASMQLLDEKFGAILDSSEAAASGVEKFKVAVSDARSELAKGPIGTSIDNTFGIGADALNRLTAGPLQKALDQARINRDEADSIVNDKSLFSHKDSNAVPPGAQKALDNQNSIVAALEKAQKAEKEGQAGAEEYAAGVTAIANAANKTGEATDDLVAATLRLGKAQELTAGNAVYDEKQLNPASVNAYVDAQLKARQEHLGDLYKPIGDLGNEFKNASTDSFFKGIEDSLKSSTSLIATEKNGVTDLRNELIALANDANLSGGAISDASRNRADAIKAQFAQLQEAQDLYKQFQASQAGAGGGDAVAKAFTDLDALLPQLRNNIDGFYAGVRDGATQAKTEIDAVAASIAATGQVTPEQRQIIDAAQLEAATEEIDRATDALTRLNSGAFDAVPGIDSLRGAYEAIIETLSSGGQLTEEQINLLGEFGTSADGASGSAGALVNVVNQLGYEYLSSNTYAAELVGQMWEIEAASASGAISGQSAAIQMASLADQIWAAAQNAHRATPELWAMLAALKALNAEGAGGGPRVQGPPAPGQTPSFLPAGALGDPLAAAKEARDRELALARQKLAQERSDALTRDKGRRDAAQAQRELETAQKKAQRDAESANKKAANATQHEFENAAKAAGNAFEKVADKIKSALEKIPGLFSTTKVTQENLDKAKAGTYVDQPDEYVHRLNDLAEHGVQREGINPQDVKDALNRVGIKAS
jgi:hypothetical protein